MQCTGSLFYLRNTVRHFLSLFRRACGWSVVKMIGEPIRGGQSIFVTLNKVPIYIPILTVIKY